MKLTLPAILAIVIGLFFSGFFTHKVLSERGQRDTTTTIVPIPTPKPVEQSNIPAAPIVDYQQIPVPVPVADDMMVVENERLRHLVDTLTMTRVQLGHVIDSLAVARFSVVPFTFNLEPGDFTGKAGVGYYPMLRQFSLDLIPGSVHIPLKTVTIHPAWWLKPALLIGGASTAYFVQNKNTTGALISGGASTVLLFIDF
jgi:hypothetical protein